MLRRFRFALKPGWLVVHVLVLAAAVTMVFLGRWQLHVSNAKHFDLQNFGYVIQWWLFATFALVMWLRILRDAARRADPDYVDKAAQEALARNDEPVAYRRYVMPSTSTPTEDDAYRSSYNDYLKNLAHNTTDEQQA